MLIMDLIILSEGSSIILLLSPKMINAFLNTSLLMETYNLSYYSDMDISEGLSKSTFITILF